MVHEKKNSFWGKVKTVFACIGAFLSAFFLALFFRRNSDRQGSGGVDERNREIEEGIISSAKGIKEADRIAGNLSETIGSRAGKCKEHLASAEDILRGAIERGKK